MGTYVKILNKAIENKALKVGSYEYKLLYKVCSCMDKSRITNKEYRRLIEAVYTLDYLQTLDFEQDSFIIDETQDYFRTLKNNVLDCFCINHDYRGYYNYLDRI